MVIRGVRVIINDKLLERRMAMTNILYFILEHSVLFVEINFYSE